MKFTRLHINALAACILLAAISTLLIVVSGDTCAAVGLAGVIGVVATRFADVGNGDKKHGARRETEPGPE